MTDARAIKIAIAALGGQGGGVLANWIVKLAETNGYIAQSTSVPGVAQRTGATIYYVELFPEEAARAASRPPVLALMPAPGDVDIVIAAELMEAGRAITRGMITARTTVIASTHRDFAIAEKIALGDGRKSGDTILAAAQKVAKRLICADMAAAARSVDAAISAALFGALAGAQALPFSRAQFEQTIRDSGRQVDNNLKGFDRGFALASSGDQPKTGSHKKTAAPENSTETVAAPAKAVAPLIDRMNEVFPTTVRPTLLEGLKRLVDYQDTSYGRLYLDRLEVVLNADRDSGGEREDWRLTTLVAKHLALWMTYEDSIRVADLKIRASRFARVRNDIRAADDQIFSVSEYLHPRVEEICDILPQFLARGVLSNKFARRALAAMLGGGRRISTTRIRGFMMLQMIASLRFARRASYRYGEEHKRIQSWLEMIVDAAPQNYSLACAIASLQRLIKGYGDTHARGWRNYSQIFSHLPQISAQANPARSLDLLIEAALADDAGAALARALSALQVEIAA